MSLALGCQERWKLAYSVIEQKKKKTLEASPSLLVLSIALPAQFRTPTLGTSLLFLSLKLEQGAGAHNAHTTDFSLLPELHRPQPQKKRRAATATQHWDWCWSALPAGEAGNNGEGWYPKILLAKGWCFSTPLYTLPPPVNETFTPKEPLPSFCPLMIRIPRPYPR